MKHTNKIILIFVNCIDHPASGLHTLPAPAAPNIYANCYRNSHRTTYSRSAYKYAAANSNQYSRTDCDDSHPNHAPPDRHPNQY